MEVVHNNEESRFEIILKSELSQLVYKHNKGSKRIYFLHTEVPKPMQNQGIAEELVKVALGYAEDNNLKIVPICPYVQAYIKRHPSYQNLIDQ